MPVRTACSESAPPSPPTPSVVMAPGFYKCGSACPARDNARPREMWVTTWHKEPYFDAIALVPAIVPRQCHRDIGHVGATCCPIGQLISRHFVSAFEAAPRRCASASRLKTRLRRLASNASPAASERSVALMSTWHRSCSVMKQASQQCLCRVHR